MDTLKKILIVEDDGDINRLIVQTLAAAGGFETVSAFSGTEALMRLDAEAFDMALLDMMLPGMNGESLLAGIRQSEKFCRIPVIVVSAVVDRQTRLSMLDGGADDYLTKPFDPDELVSRVRAVFRRTASSDAPTADGNENKLIYKDFAMDTAAREVIFCGKPLNLTLREFDILKTLLSHPKKVFSRINLYESVWGEAYLSDESTVNVHVSNLRAKIAAAQPPDAQTEPIKTVWGIGFKME